MLIPGAIVTVSLSRNNAGELPYQKGYPIRLNPVLIFFLVIRQRESYRR